MNEERKIVSIDVGDIPPEEVDAYMEKMIKRMKKVPYVSLTGEGYNRFAGMEYDTEPPKKTRWQRFKQWCKDAGYL